MPFDYIKRLLSASEAEPVAPDDARAAIATVLVMAARIDADYSSSEQKIIDDVIKARFDLTEEAAKALREQGEAAESEAIDHYQFTRAIKTAVVHEDRVAVVEALWQVVMADEERDAHEDALMRQLVDRLGLSPMESAQARQRVIARGAAGSATESDG